MAPYLFLLFFVTIAAYFGRRIGVKEIKNISIFFIVSALVLFSGLRNGNIGTDTETYIKRFYDSESFESVFRTSEVGYNFLSWFAHSISDSYSGLLLLIAFIVVVCYSFSILKIVGKYEISFFIFIALGAYTFSFNGARQGIAAAICFVGIFFLLQRRLLCYLMVVVCAALFHQTAWVALLLYPIASKKADWRKLVMIVVASLALIVFLQAFIGAAALLLDDKFSAYAEVGDGGGRVWVAFLVCQGLVLFFFKKNVHDPEFYYVRLLNIYLAGLVLALASSFSGVNPSGLLRLHLYFSSVSILMWPMVLYSFKNAALRDIVMILFMVVAIFFYYITTSSFSNLTPYELNQDSMGWII